MNELNRLPGIARAAIDAWLGRRPYAAPTLRSHDDPHGVFVTLRDRAGELRGCIGHIEPQHDRVSAEVAECAVLAASEDPRFRPLTASELPTVSIEVSVLTPPEETTVEALDPRRYGIVVENGRRRGVLLPDLDGVDTVADQVRITLRKAGIHADEPYRVHRFEVVKLEE